MIESKTAKLLLDCIITIEQNLQTKKRFLASLCLQDKVLAGLHELSEISRSISWVYHGMRIKSAWYRINSLVLQQLLLPGVQGVDRYKIWEVASECLPIIKSELKLWANPRVDFGNARIIKELKKNIVNLIIMSRDKAIIIGFVAFLILSLLDDALTLWGLRLGVIEEVNPIMRWVIEKSQIVFMTVKQSLPVALGLLLWKIRNRSRKFVACSLGFVLILYSVVIMFNVYWIVVYE